MASLVPFVHGQERPLQSRVVRSSGRRPPVVPCMVSSDRPSTYRSYGAERMVRALEAVQRGELSIRRAAEEYGVPRTTLQDKAAGRSDVNAKSGRPLLTVNEEKSLADFLIGCASIGYAKSRKDVLSIVQQILYSRGVVTEVTKGWWDSFRMRHPNLTLRHAEPLSYARAQANDAEVINRYFDLLEDTIRENGLTNRPAQIFNCDETGLPLTHQPPKVVACVGQKHPYTVTSSDKAQITVLACGSAAGYSIPPMVIFDRKSLKPEMTIGEVPSTFYGLSDNGWMDTELFQEWFKNHFLIYAPPVRPLLLLLDGHTSHYQPELLRIAAAEGVILFCLPPHTTHLLQPLDNGAFGSLKRHWGEACHKFCSRNPGKVVNRYNFSQVFHTAWVEGMGMRNIIASFRAVGVYPISRDVVLSQLPGGLIDSQCHPSGSVPFVPFCTPRQPQLPEDCIPPHAPPQHSSPSIQLQVDHQAHHTPVSSLPSGLAFSSLEVRRYRIRLEEGYDLPDSRYSQWLSTLSEHNSNAVEPPVTSEKTVYVPTHSSTLEKILHVPTPPAQRKTTKYAKGARVITSEECIQQAQVQEERRKQKEDDKRKRATERLRKAEERQKKAEEKRRHAEEKQKKKEELEKRKAEEKQKKLEEKQKKLEDKQKLLEDKQKKRKALSTQNEDIENGVLIVCECLILTTTLLNYTILHSYRSTNNSNGM